MSSFLSSFLTLRRLPGHDLTAVSAAAAAPVGAQASQILRRRSLQVRTLFRHRQSLGGVLVAVGRVRVAVGRVLVAVVRVLATVRGRVAVGRVLVAVGRVRVAVGCVRVAVGASGRQGGQVGHVHVDRLGHH
jgi:hypothetical protein